MLLSLYPQTQQRCWTRLVHTRVRRRENQSFDYGHKPIVRYSKFGLNSCHCWEWESFEELIIISFLFSIYIHNTCVCGSWRSIWGKPLKSKGSQNPLEAKEMSRAHATSKLTWYGSWRIATSWRFRERKRSREKVGRPSEPRDFRRRERDRQSTEVASHCAVAKNEVKFTELSLV